MMHAWGFGGGAGYPTSRKFEEQYYCYSVAYADKAHLEKGDKILLPPSAFDTLARLQVDYPMLFRLTADSGTATHSGVLEFTAEEGCCYIPFWMMQNLKIEEGALLTVTNVSLPKASFVKLQAQSVDFLEISNPRAVLEHALRNYSCVTVNDIIQIPYNDKNYRLQLKEVKPSPAACIIETDCNVDFDAPLGYVEPTSQRSSACPSPSTTMSSATAGSLHGGGTSSGALSSSSALLGGDAEEDDSKPAGIRIVDGKIVRPDEQTEQEKEQAALAKILADQAGQTGVQRNAAIPEQAPDVAYWAVNAGGGARLDGKTPTALKDSSGNAVDIRQLRAEAAARRAAAAAKEAQENSSIHGMNLQGSGTTLNGKPPPAETAAEAATLPAAVPPVVSKRKSKVAGKYSRLKTSSTTFQGSANSFKK